MEYGDPFSGNIFHQMLRFRFNIEDWFTSWDQRSLGGDVLFRHYNIVITLHLRLLYDVYISEKNLSTRKFHEKQMRHKPLRHEYQI